MGKRLLIGFLFTLLGLGTFVTYPLSADVPRMTKDELKALLGNPDLIILDVRRASDWNSSDLRIKGALREEAGEVDSWAAKYSKDKIIVLYCA
jgi:rhodanese-related sulfurtransferase